MKFGSDVDGFMEVFGMEGVLGEVYLSGGHGKFEAMEHYGSLVREGGHKFGMNGYHGSFMMIMAEAYSEEYHGKFEYGGVLCGLMEEQYGSFME
ncbi:hypothetical protein AVEN_160200-1 [Araneus ventricosus]|uniref:Uncharacterized protein n=1 Tax=Araneus ventricosus TaxID=182803 RepID=A0A4Y2TS17_ARAVE|nr:hypothetical protein AVEN_160200-1 [Araneus ventricosus]